MGALENDRYLDAVRAPSRDDILEAVRFLLDGVTIPDRYFQAILDLVEAEYVRRARAGDTSLEAGAE